MKISGKGVIVILVFIVIIPVTIDLFLSISQPKYDGSFKMSRILSGGYLKALPFYIGYLIIAFTIYYLIRQWQKSQTRHDD